MQAGSDIQSKLSTQNVLDELFCKFTSRSAHSPKLNCEEFVSPPPI